MPRMFVALVAFIVKATSCPLRSIPSPLPMGAPMERSGSIPNAASRMPTDSQVFLK